MIKIYHVPNTRSLRAIWVCRELDIDCEVVMMDFSPDYRKSEEWRAISPTGKVPAMAVDEGGQTFTMFESGAMVDCLLERYGEGRLRPAPGTPDSAHNSQWSWFAEATLARPLGDVVHHTIFKPEAERIPAVVVDATERAEVCLDAVEKTVADRRYLLGDDFYSADIMMGYSLLLAERLGILDDRYPNTLAYLDRLRARPAFEGANPS